MRIFVTGASGWIGSAVVAEFHRAGHQVVGLARSDASAQAIAGAGAEVCRGDIDDLIVLRAAAADSDGVVHLAFRHDIAFSGDFETAVATDRAAIETLGDALAGSGRPLAIARVSPGWSPAPPSATSARRSAVRVAGCTTSVSRSDWPSAGCAR